MIQFIFLFPVLYFPIKKNKVKGYLFCVVLNVIYELIFQRVYGMTELYYRMIVFRYIFLIASGILLVYYDGEKTLCHMILCAVTFMTGVAYIYIFRYKAVPLSVFRYWIGTSMLPSLYIVSIIYAGWRYLKKMHFKPLEIIGKASYDIFLIQMVYFLFCDYILRGIESILLQTLVSVIICVVVGVLFYYVERGLTEYLRKRVVMIIHNH